MTQQNRMFRSGLLTAAAILCLALFASAAWAAEPKGGFVPSPGAKGPTPGSTVTVSQIADMKDDAWVILRGKIARQVGDERYEFSDNTGTIVVEIDDDDWGGQYVTPDDTVEIRGEVDKHMMKDTTIEVKQIVKVTHSL